MTTPADEQAPPRRPVWPRALLALALGTGGGWLANLAGLPLPWMIGAMLATTGAALAGLPVALWQRLREGFVVVLGVMLGSSFTPEIAAQLPGWGLSIVILSVYTVVSGGLGAWFFHRVAGYDRITSYFSAMPGGLSVMIFVGEAMGGDSRLISLTHASRLLLVVLILPMPRWLLDISLAISITFSVLILMTVLFISRPLEFSSFPTILLIATMLRLSLNLASTRLILANGHEGTDAAGEVIEAFGNFVVGGNLVVGLVSFLSEIGIEVTLAATGTKNKDFAPAVRARLQDPQAPCTVLHGADHATLLERLRENKPDVLLGSSKGFTLSKELGIPLLRTGFPVHDRIGGQRIQHIGYRGTQQLFDRVVNLFLELKQNSNAIGYSYL